MLYEAAAALFVAQVYAITLPLAAQLKIVGLAILAAVGIAGVPEAGLVTLSLVIGGVGLPLSAVPLLLPVDWMLNRLRATTNVASDLVVANVLDRFRYESGNAATSACSQRPSDSQPCASSSRPRRTSTRSFDGTMMTSCPSWPCAMNRSRGPLGRERVSGVPRRRGRRDPEAGAVDVAVGRRAARAREVDPALGQDALFVPHAVAQVEQAEARPVARRRVHQRAEPMNVPAASNSGCADVMPSGPNSSSSMSTSATRARRSAALAPGANTRPSASAIRFDAGRVVVPVRAGGVDQRQRRGVGGDVEPPSPKSMRAASLRVGSATPISW